MFVHKYGTRLAKDISTLQAESEMLKPGERNQHNEDSEAIAAELALLKKLAGLIEQFTRDRCDKELTAWRGLSKSEERLKDPWSEIKISPKNLKPEDFAPIILEPPVHPVKLARKTRKDRQ